MKNLPAFLFLAALPLVAAELRPNFVLMMTDDQGWGSITERSEIVKTPGLDSLIANGIHFTRFYSASSVCSPTRAAFLTGRSPIRVGVPNANVGHIREDETTIAELAKMAGYATGHFGKWHIGTFTKLRNDGRRGKKNPKDFAPSWRHGYDRVFATESKVPTYNPMVDISDYPYSKESGKFFGTYYWTEPDDIDANEGNVVDFDSLKGDDAELLVDRTLSFIDSSLEANTPFMTTLWFHTPHWPVVVPKDTANKYYPNIANERDRSYYASIEMMSNQVLRLYKHLESKGVLDNTFILFTSDNGGAHTQDFAPQEAVNVLRGGKANFYEGGIRVPGMIVWPDRIPRKIVTSFPVTTSDIYPTIKAILELAVDNQKPVDGINLLPVIDALVAGQEGLRRLKPMGFLRGSAKAWIDGDMKIVKMGKSWETFDVAGDISEETDLTKTNAKVHDSLLKEFGAWNTAVKNDKPHPVAQESNALPVKTTMRGSAMPLLLDFRQAEAEVFDVTGRRIGSFVNDSPRLRWNGRIGGKTMARGVYLVRAYSGSIQHAEKIVVR